MTSDKNTFYKELREFAPVLGTLVLSMVGMGVVFYTFWQVTAA